MQLQRAVKYLENVREKKEAIPFRRYNGSMGRTGQGMWHSHCLNVLGGKARHVAKVEKDIHPDIKTYSDDGGTTTMNARE